MTVRDRRGKRTVEQMLASGVEVFARLGPDGVSTRELARAAGVNVAAIQYYFGGKEGYYIAVVEHLIEKLSKPLLDTIRSISRQVENLTVTPEDALGMLYQTVQVMVRRLLSTPETRFFASISVREHLNPTPAYDVIYDALSGIHIALSKLVARVVGVPPDSLEAVVRAHAIVGEILMFRLGEMTLCRRLGWKTISNDEVEKIAKIVADMACSSLGFDMHGKRR